MSRLNSYEETALEIVNKFTASRAAKELKQMLKGQFIIFVDFDEILSCL